MSDISVDWTINTNFLKTPFHLGESLFHSVIGIAAQAFSLDLP